MEQPSRFKAVGPRGKEADRHTHVFEVPAGLDQLVFAASGRLESKRRRVEQHGSRLTMTLTSPSQPR
jgi:hypothetical protein